jgi:dihydroorotate dehydrogenase electron transfer subunit
MKRYGLHHRASVVKNIPVCADHYHLILRDDAVARKTAPGQFVNLKINNREELLLRRPFSVAITRPEQSLFEIVYHVVGKGTRAMVDLRPGELVDLMGPFGNGFHLPERPMSCLLLGGGCGVAPLWGLVEPLSRGGNKIIALLGFQSSDRVFGEEVFTRYGAEVVVTTEDGSYGLKGFVSDHLEETLRRQVDRVYICGPMPMIKVVIPMISKQKIKGEVSLEEKMGCGYGACLSCVAKIWKDGVVERERVCTEGPVFPLEEIVLDDEA